MSNAPHLPPKSHSPQRNLKEFFVSLVVTVIVSFSAGIAASTVAFAYLIPEAPASRPTLNFLQNKPSAETSQKSLTEQEKLSAKEKIITVLDSRKKIGEMHDANAKLGVATFFTVDGWAVLAPVNSIPADVSVVEALDSQGRILKIKKIIKDEETGFVFLQVDGNGFSVFSLGNGDIPTQNSVWTFDGKNFIEQKTFVQYSRTKETSKNIVEQGTRLVSPTGFVSLVFGESGELLGFADKLGNIFSGSEINTKLRFFQKNGILSKTIFAVSGYVVDGVKKDDRGMVIEFSGFVVTESSRSTKTGLQVGDVILGIQGKKFSPQTIREEISGGNGELVFHVLRKGTEMDVTVKK